MREMKNSGVYWLGDIPSSWRVEKVKYGFFRKKTEAHQDNPTVLSLSRNGIKERDISNNEGQIAESYYNYNLVEAGDLLINPMDLYSGANCSISKISGVISPAYVNLKSRDGYDPEYFDYYFKIQYWLMAFFAFGKGVSYDNRWTLSSETLMNYPIIVPSYNEQKRIVHFVNSQCLQIDSMISKQETIIERLKDYKQSIIYEAVTKGINPSVKTVESHQDWIGRIPVHWGLIKLKYATQIMRGRFNHRPRNDPEFYDGKYPFVQTGDVARSSKYIVSYSQTLNEKGYSVSKEFPKGCVCMVIAAAKVGDVAILDFDACFPDSVVGFKPTATTNRDYLFYVLSAMKQQLMRNATISTIPNLNVEIIKEEFIPIPPYEEQLIICDELNKRCEEIDLDLEKRNSLISKLNNYKKSLIYEVITGKKEV